MELPEIRDGAWFVTATPVIVSDNKIRATHEIIEATLDAVSDGMLVLDPQLRVRGIEGLRVADCSIMPALVSGNTGAPTMMIADRCADFMLADA